jgi:hypothetical protein
VASRKIPGLRAAEVPWRGSMEPAGTRRWNRRPSAPLKGHSRGQGDSAAPEPEKASREQGLGHVHLAGETSHVASAGFEPASEISRGEVQ